MNRKLQLLNHSLLFLCASLYLGTGWSIVLFTFPIAPQFTVDNYALHFVPQIASATIFFSVVTTLMIVTAAVMFWCERRTPFKWVPAVVLASVCCAASLTMIFIFPVNRAMTEGITDPAALADYVARWKTLHSVRMAFWTTNWLAVMIYFAVKLYQRETEHGQLEMAQAGAARHRGGHGAERAGAGASA